MDPSAQPADPITSLRPDDDRDKLYDVGRSPSPLPGALLFNPIPGVPLFDDLPKKGPWWCERPHEFWARDLPNNAHLGHVAPSMRVDTENFPTDHNGRDTSFGWQNVHLLNKDPRSGKEWPDTPSNASRKWATLCPLLPGPPHQSGPSPHEALEQDDAGHLDRSYP